MKRVFVVAATAAALLVPAVPASAAPFRNCTEAFAAGVDNIPASDPRYAKRLDRDNDGIGCERSGGSSRDGGSADRSRDAGSKSLPKTGSSEAMKYGLAGGALVALGIPFLVYRRRPNVYSRQR
jgi:LPXTG-motif cell wall-anchored protein